MAKGQKRSSREPKKAQAAKKTAGPALAGTPPVRIMAKPGGSSRQSRS